MQGTNRLMVLRFLAVLAVAVLLPSRGMAQYPLGAFGATNSGAWNVVTTWSTWNGLAWTPAVTIPSGTSSAYILTGRTVHLPLTGPYQVGNLTVEDGAKLWTQNNAQNIYLYIYGTTLRCDGQIGDGATFDGISFGIEGANVLLDGAGMFDASRMRKNTNANVTTNLTIDMDVNLRFATGSTTQIYNNFQGSSNFNVTINAGRTVNLTGPSGEGNIAMDGIDGLATTERGGTYVINGTLLVSGMIYMTTNNTNTSFPCRMIINNGGYVRAERIVARASGAATHRLEVNNGGTLELTGAVIPGSPPTNVWQQFSTANNQYVFGLSSQTIYSASGDQDVVNVTGGYGHVRIRGGGTKFLTGLTAMRGNVEILNTDGSPVLDVTTSNWQLNVGGNWTNYSESGFNERTGLVLFNLGNLQVLNTAGGERFHHWRIGKLGATQTRLESDMTLVDRLEMNGGGILDLNGNMLSVLNGASNAISAAPAFTATRHIRSEATNNSSRIRWNIGANNGPHVFPFGAPTVPASYLPFTFTRTAGNAGFVTVSTYGTGPDNLPWPVAPTPVTNLNSEIGLLPDNRDATVDRFWQVDVTGSPVATMTFTYAASELPVSPYDTPLGLHAQRYDGVLNKWQPPLEGQGLAFYSATVPNVSVFGPWAISAAISPLPVELLSFNATATQQGVELVWATASERDNDHFTVLRSADGILFEELMRMPGAGNSQQRLDYDALDEDPLKGWSYYQLRQTDVDGSTSLSNLVAVYVDPASAAGITVFPNPASDHVRLSGLPEGTEVVRVLDASGRVVRSLVPAATAAMEAIDLGGLPAGRYVVSVVAARNVEALPLIIVR